MFELQLMAAVLVGAVSPLIWSAVDSWIVEREYAKAEKRRSENPWDTWCIAPFTLMGPCRVIRKQDQVSKETGSHEN